MPLILVCGRPCTGKTVVASIIAEHFKNANTFSKVVHVNEESLQINRSTGYANGHTEKELRGNLKSAVEHVLNDETLVILDSLNYIKGYRYELYCAARAAKTPYCVVWVATDYATASSLNEARLENGYTRFNEVWSRFETPNSSNRWDSPLFKVNIIPPAVSVAASSTSNCTTTSNEAAGLNIANTDISSQSTTITSDPPVTVPKKSSWKPKKKITDLNAAGEGDAVAISVEDVGGIDKVQAPTSSSAVAGSTPVFETTTLSVSGLSLSSSEDLSQFQSLEEQLDRLTAHLSTVPSSQPNASTIVSHRGDADLVYELDRTSQRIAQIVLTHQAGSLEGTPIKFVDFERALTLPRHISNAELQRIRNQFVKMHSHHPPPTSIAIGTAFIEYLALHL